MAKKQLVVIAHAPSPNTARMRDALLRGAQREAGQTVEARWVAPLEAGPKDVLGADALILGTTENLGYMSGALKDFFDRSYYPCLDRTPRLPYALIIRAGNDGTGTRRAVESIARGLRWRAIQPPLICRGPWRDEFLAQCEELGAAVTAGLELGIFGS